MSCLKMGVKQPFTVNTGGRAETMLTEQGDKGGGLGDLALNGDVKLILLIRGMPLYWSSPKVAWKT